MEDFSLDSNIQAQFLLLEIWCIYCIHNEANGVSQQPLRNLEPLLKVFSGRVSLQKQKHLRGRTGPARTNKLSTICRLQRLILWGNSSWTRRQTPVSDVSSAVVRYLSAVMFGRGAAVAAWHGGYLLGHGWGALLWAHRAADWPVQPMAEVPGPFLSWKKRGWRCFRKQSKACSSLLAPAKCIRLFRVISFSVFKSQNMGCNVEKRRVPSTSRMNCLDVNWSAGRDLTCK